MSKQITNTKNASEQVVEQDRWDTPLVDVFENDDEFLLAADLPGVVNDSLRIDVDNEELLIEGRRPKDDRWGHGFRRSFKVPAGTDFERVNAELKQGVLWLHLPKAAAIKPRRIAVKAG